MKESFRLLNQQDWLAQRVWEDDGGRLRQREQAIGVEVFLDFDPICAE